ncbi:DUF1960-domain-containing protein [Lentinula detonsa]|uniref:DUF1960-domain-containing protein n=1 Tax=Lentinula detonsa TaxID=2804962 RepID=A0A9W8NVN4_9AGAR|nr:DUF1960-domain-containing protein [Lentinula detonsa]KAJ3981748.1 DUF1960-domain-containing protein [Lentinula detonsa]
MPRELTKVVHKPDPQKSEEYIIIVNPAEYKKWIQGDTSIPLSEVVDSFQVFYSTSGNQGLLGQASNQQLENHFGTSKDTDVVEIILKRGKDQPGDAISTQTFMTNATRGSGVIDSKGKGLTGI